MRPLCACPTRNSPRSSDFGDRHAVWHQCGLICLSGNSILRESSGRSRTPTRIHFRAKGGWTISYYSRMKNTSQFSREDAKRFYDRFGRRQDRQDFYEDAALAALIQHGDFSAAQSVFELGCGTGRLAARLLAEDLPSSAHYIACDISETMVHLAEKNLAPWPDRSAVHLGGHRRALSSYNGLFDRFVAAYVFDLLSPEEIAETLVAAHSSLQKGGLLCTAGLTYGIDGFSTATSKLWGLLRKIRPALVGGCRPIAVTDFILGTEWRILHREVVVSNAIPSEVLIAEAI